MDDSCDLFVLYKQYPSGGTIWLMLGLGTSGSDYKDIMAIAKYLAKNGHEVKVLHAIHYKDQLYREVYGELIGTRFYRKCPDLLIDGRFYEYESYDRPFKSRKISHMLKRGAAQSSRIIIDNNRGASDRFIINMIENRLKDKNFRGDIEEVYLYEKGEVRPLFKKKR
ncbi:MAG: hypothetical protein IJP81_02160 [Bacteroidales bacterium]|nr:hypothetical protein [Bacteroidales bacterium]